MRHQPSVSAISTGSPACELASADEWPYVADRWPHRPISGASLRLVYRSVSEPHVRPPTLRRLAVQGVSLGCSIKNESA